MRSNLTNMLMRFPGKYDNVYWRCYYLSYDEFALYRGNATDCLAPGTYIFVISDVIGDGISPPGYYKIVLERSVACFEY